MKDRILHIMREKGMSQQEFAKAIEVSPASLSNIFNGRTNPTNNHVNAIHHHFPDISINWLMFGEGDMYVSSDAVSSDGSMTDGGNVVSPMQQNAPDGTLFTQQYPNTGGSIQFNADESANGTDIRPEQSPVPVLREVVKYIDKPQRKITEIRIFFDDGTYEVFGGR